MKVNTVATLSALAAICIPAHEPRAQAASVDTVARLYRDFVWETDDDLFRPGETLLEQPREVLARYFDAPLTDLILADRACAAEFQATCRLDFSPIWASQDPVGLAPTISPTSERAVVMVQLRYSSNAQWEELSYRMVETRTGWRIHDIDYGDRGSLLAILNRQIHRWMQSGRVMPNKRMQQTARLGSKGRSLQL